MAPALYPDFLEECRRKIEGQDPTKYLNVLQRLFDPTVKEPYRAIHAALVRTRFTAFVTTNYDNCLEKAGRLEPAVLRQDSVQSYPDELSSTDLDKRFVTHVHGRAYDQDGRCRLSDIVLTRRDFDAAYARPDLCETLRRLISDFSVLFLGFSSADGVLQGIIENHLNRYVEDMLKSNNSLKLRLNRVRYYVLCGVQRVTRDAEGAAATGTLRSPEAGFDPEEADYERQAAIAWFNSSTYPLAKHVYPIAYAYPKGDRLHAPLTNLTEELQRNASWDPHGMRRESDEPPSLG